MGFEQQRSKRCHLHQLAASGPVLLFAVGKAYAAWCRRPGSEHVSSIQQATFAFQLCTLCTAGALQIHADIRAWTHCACLLQLSPDAPVLAQEVTHVTYVEQVLSVICADQLGLQLRSAVPACTHASVSYQPASML